MAAITLKPDHGQLLYTACVEAPLRGLTLADLDRIDTIKKLVFVAEETTVEIGADLLPLLRKLWAALDYGSLRRVDGLADRVREVTALLNPPKE